ncbi:sulfatase-like hydrolase/transferase [Gallaecimonas xiamenensis]|uniref:Hydrolase n=1 Tax=Gallaecimonas xiamenensis 3-C-1 TaxID=745411 RepID=K2JB96_9GAMM|nr:sulfatase-like hydrolase/transferase [Gallaecimonas xiamenensis]EKE67849.1 hydrolase [Gallaecimonas xiamenensis 3-C-1]
MPFMSRVSRFWLLALLPLAALLWRFSAFMPPMTPLSALYLVLTLVGWYGLLLGLLALASSLFALLPRRLGATLVVVMGACAGALAWVDLEVFEQYRFHLSPFVFDLFFSEPGEVISFSWLTWLAGIAAMLGCLFICVGLWHFSRARWPSWPAWTLVALCFLSSQLWHAVADARADSRITVLTRNLPAYQPLTAKRFMVKHGWAKAHTETQALDFHQKGALRYPLSPLSAHPKQKLNVLYLLVDAWRADELNPQVAPNISTFAKSPDTKRYLNHYSGGNSTQAGIFSLFYSLPATYWGAFAGSQQGPVLMDWFKENDYAFGIYGSATLRSPAFDKTVFSGISPLHSQAGEEKRWRRDSNSVEQFGQFLEQRDPKQPFFGFLFFDAVHAYDFPPDFESKVEPYWQRVDHIKLNNDFDPTPYRNRYRTAVRYVDSLVGKVLEQLKAKGLLDNTIVVISADHGEEFNDHHKNYWGHGSNYSDAQVKVPLVIHWPGKEGGEVSYRTSHFDLVPTLAQDLFDVEAPLTDYSLGQPLSRQGDRPWLLVGSYYNYALKGNNEMVVAYPTGQTELLSGDLSPLPGRPPAQAIKAALTWMGRFYR